MRVDKRIPRTENELKQYIAVLSENESRLTREINEIRREIRQLEKELKEKNRKYRRLTRERRKIREELEKAPIRFRDYKYRVRRWALLHVGLVFSRIQDDRLWRTKG